MATLEALRRSTGRKTGMDYSVAGTDRDLLDSWLNEGVREVLIRTHCYVASSTITTTASTWQYDLSYAVMAIKQIWRDGETSPMIRVPPEEIIELRRTSSATTDATSLRWALLGANQLLLWPTPSSAYVITLIYVPRPTEMASNEHDPSSSIYGGIPVEYHKAIELWALSNASDHEHEGRSQSGQKYLAEFETYMRTVKVGLNRKAGRLPAARVGRSRRPVTGNGRYP